MGVHCLTGRRGSGKTTRCVGTIRKLLGTGAPILFSCRSRTRWRRR